MNVPTSLGPNERLAPTPTTNPAPWFLAPPPGGDFADTLRKLLRRKWLIAGCLFGAVVLTIVVAALLPQRYTATTQLLVGVPSTKLGQIQSVVPDPTVDIAAIQSESYILQSRDLAGRVVDRLGLDKIAEFNPALRPETLWDRLDPRRLFREAVQMFAVHEPRRSGASTKSAAADDGQTTNPERESVIDTLRERLDVFPLDRSHVIGLAIESQDATLAARIANAYARTYIEDQMVNKVAMTDRADKWLQEHIRRLRDQVEKDDRAVEDYRRAHGLYETQKDTITDQQLADLNTQLILAQATKAEADARLRQAKQKARSADAADTMPDVLNSPLIQALQQQQSIVERRVADLSAHYGAKYPDMVRAKAELKDIKRKIHTEIVKIIAGLRNAAETANARYEALRKNLDSMKNVAGRDNESTIKLRALQRESEASRALFEEFLQSSKETAVQRDFQQPDAQIVSRASVPNRPSFPPLDLLFVVGIVGGLLVGILVALLAEQFDSTFRTEDEVEEMTGLRALAVVPRISRRRLSGDYSTRNPTSAYSEAMRRLDMSLRLGEKESSSRVVMVASGAANEGKSGICLSLARMAAAAGSNVIVVDCDWRRPRLHSLLHRPNKMGLGELLTGRVLPDDVVYRDSSGAHLIFAGQLRPRHTHLLFSERMRYLLASLTRHYDLVLIDTPPVTVGAEILHLSQMVDKAIYVVRWGHTPRDVVLKGLRQLAAIGAPVVGVVLSRVDPKRYRRYARGGHDYTNRSYTGRKVA